MLAQLREDVAYAVLFALACALPLTTAAGQKVTALGDGMTPPLKVIGAPKSIVRSDREGILADLPLAVAPLSDGSYVLVTMKFVAGRVSPSGDLSYLLKMGSGPFEQQSARMLAAYGDTLQLFDIGLRRRTTLIRGRPVSSTAWPLPLSAVVRTRGGYLINAQVPTAAGAGLPLHLVDTLGRVVKSFGDELSSLRVEDAKRFRRVVAQERGPCAWIAMETEFSIDCVADDGTVTQRLTGAPQVWKDAIPSKSDAGGGKPSPAISSIAEAADGTLLVSLVIAVPAWKAALRENAGRSNAVSRYLAARQSMIVRIDPRSGSISAPMKIPGYVTAVFKDGRIIAFTEDVDGQTHLIEHRLAAR